MKFQNLILLLLILSVGAAFGCRNSGNIQSLIPTQNLIITSRNPVSHFKPAVNHSASLKVIKDVKNSIFGVTAKCKDGHLSHHRQGACSHHGGVNLWY